MNALIRFSLFVIISLLLSTLKNALEREEKLATTDFLTDAINSRLFFDLLSNEIDRLRRYGRPFTLAYIDLDNFKEVNDQFGHPEGDRALRTIVRYAKNHLRKIDVVARLGGDELALILPEISQESASAVLGKMRTGLLQEMRKNNWPITFSIGAITCNDAAPPTPERIVKETDKLMYEVKRSGKDAIRHSVYEG